MGSKSLNRLSGSRRSLSDLRPTLHSSGLFCVEGSLNSLGSEVSWLPAWLGPCEGLVTGVGVREGQEGGAEFFSSLSACVGHPAVVHLLTQAPTAQTHRVQL